MLTPFVVYYIILLTTTNNKNKIKGGRQNGRNGRCSGILNPFFNRSFGCYGLNVNMFTSIRKSHEMRKST